MGREEGEAWELWRGSVERSRSVEKREKRRWFKGRSFPKRCVL
jgi:hypothetical protein